MKQTHLPFLVYITCIQEAKVTTLSFLSTSRCFRLFYSNRAPLRCLQPTLQLCHHFEQDIVHLLCGIHITLFPIAKHEKRKIKKNKTKNKPAKFICSHFGFEKKKKIFTKYRDKRSDFFFFLRYKCKLSQQPQTSLRFPAESRREKKKKNAKLNSSKLCLPLGSPFFIIRPPS